jgi:uncharacterized membrane protein (DUF485 family)
MSPGSLFAIIVIIISFIALIVFIVNAWNWSRIFNGTLDPIPITRSEAGWFLAFNVILAIIAFALLVYSIIVLAYAPRRDVVRTVSNGIVKKSATGASLSTAGVLGTPFNGCSTGIADIPARSATMSNMRVPPGQPLYSVQSRTIST